MRASSSRGIVVPVGFDGVDDATARVSSRQCCSTSSRVSWKRVCGRWCPLTPQTRCCLASRPPWAARPIPRIADGGLPAVLSQTFRSLIHSRLLLGLKSYEQAYPNNDIVLIEPDHRDPELYLANTFSYSQRRPGRTRLPANPPVAALAPEPGKQAALPRHHAEPCRAG